MININTYMKKFFNSLKRDTGFTLIELLVVIGILGVLAAMLVATIDPFEQIKKAQDSSVQNATVEFEGAMIRYYTAQNGFPWDSNSNNGHQCMLNLGSAYTAPVGGVGGALANITLEKFDVISDPNPGCITELITTGELKTGFLTQQGTLKSITVSSPDLSAKTILVCYRPLSRAGQNDKNANWIYDVGTKVWSQEPATTPPSSAQCPADGAVLDSTHWCYWCTE